jgi:HipA-like protein
MTYVPDVVPENLVSLTMPFRTESYSWDDQLHPIFQMNLPEGYLLQVLQEEFGPHIGASPVALLSVIGRNMVGRLQVAPPGGALDEPAKLIEVAELQKGDNSEKAFSQLLREHAKSGASGVLPKFLEHRTKEASRAGAAQEGLVADPRAHYQRVIQQASVRDCQRALVHAGGSEGCRMCENRTLSGRQCSRRAPVRCRWERETVQSVGRFLCATRTSAIREIRNDMGANREGGSDLSAGRKSARDLPEAEHNPAVHVRAEER